MIGTPDWWRSFLAKQHPQKTTRRDVSRFGKNNNNGTQITHCYPLSAVGRFQIYFEGFSEPSTCSGALIGAHTVLTAAHCFPLATTNVEFTPGQFGDYKPFGSFKNGVVYKSEEFNWSNGSNDYAIVKFSEDIGALTRWLGVQYHGCENMEAKRGYDLMVAGFADDKGDQMWTAKCNDTFVDQCANGNKSGNDVAFFLGNNFCNDVVFFG
eukprot:TRINITY_DN1791_c1_g2_i1.p1 TRINITY_DN1791_c1_g2~~TRINITY_DN1791_c1_g2_i1.p1  ORF type:complete len:210 (+),score=30.32 TRINITY_DN1791_c1_g2_i1:303-932(+)